MRSDHATSLQEKDFGEINTTNRTREQRWTHFSAQQMLCLLRLLDSHSTVVPVFCKQVTEAQRVKVPHRGQPSSLSGVQMGFFLPLFFLSFLFYFSFIFLFFFFELCALFLRQGLPLARSSLNRPDWLVCGCVWGSGFVCLPDCLCSGGVNSTPHTCKAN